MIDLENIDTILYVDPTMVTETDDRMYATRKPDATNYGDKYFYVPADYKSYDSFGGTLSSLLGNIGPEWSVEVSDFRKYVVVRTSYHNRITGRGAEKTFLIVFEKGGNGFVLNTMSKWRSISGASQAASYIRGVCGALKTNADATL